MKEKLVFGDLIRFSAGTNLTRIQRDISNDCIYTLEDFDSDLSTLDIDDVVEDIICVNNKNVISEAGDVVISMTRNQAGIVSKKNSGKYLTSNFIKCEFDREKLYPWYFCYLLNEAPTINQQIKKMQQGTIGCINRLTINMIGSLVFEIKDISQQKMIGDLYRNILIRENLVLKHMKDMRKMTFEIIRRVDTN